MGMAIGGPGGGHSAEMNVTPLIDVLLVLIIIFMIIIPPSKTMGLNAAIPQPAQQQDSPITPVRTIIVEVVKTSGDRAALKINRVDTTWEELGRRLHDIYKTRAERVLFVKAEPELSFDPVAQVIDIAHTAYPDIRVGLLTTEIEAGK